MEVDKIMDILDMEILPIMVIPQRTLTIAVLEDTTLGIITPLILAIALLRKRTFTREMSQTFLQMRRKIIRS